MAAVPDGEDDLEVYVLHMGTGRWRRITRDAADAYPSDWLPDGAAMLLVIWRTENGPSRLFSVDPDGSHRRLISDDAGDARTTSAGRWAFFSHATPRGGWTSLYRVPLEGGDARRLLPIPAHVVI